MNKSFLIGMLATISVLAACLVPDAPGVLMWAPFNVAGACWVCYSSGLSKGRAMGDYYAKLDSEIKRITPRRRV